MSWQQTEGPCPHMTLLSFARIAASIIWRSSGFTLTRVQTASEALLIFFTGFLFRHRLRPFEATMRYAPRLAGNIRLKMIAKFS